MTGTAAAQSVLGLTKIRDGLPGIAAQTQFLAACSVVIALVTPAYHVNCVLAVQNQVVGPAAGHVRQFGDLHGVPVGNQVVRGQPWLSTGLAAATQEDVGKWEQDCSAVKWSGEVCGEGQSLPLGCFCAEQVQGLVVPFDPVQGVRKVKLLQELSAELAQVLAVLLGDVPEILVDRTELRVGLFLQLEAFQDH